MASASQYAHCSDEESCRLKHVFRNFLLKLLRFVNASHLLVAKRTRSRVLTTSRVFIIRPDHLGDLVLTTPVLGAIKSALPSVHITMLVGPWSKVIVERHPAVDRLIAFPFPGLQRSSKRQRFTHIALVFLALRLRRES